MSRKIIIIFLICILVNTISFSQVCEIDSVNYTHVDCFGGNTGSISVTLLQPDSVYQKPIGGLVLMDFMQIKH